MGNTILVHDLSVLARAIACQLMKKPEPQGADQDAVHCLQVCVNQCPQNSHLMLACHGSTCQATVSTLQHCRSTDPSQLTCCKARHSHSTTLHIARLLNIMTFARTGSKVMAFICMVAQGSKAVLNSSFMHTSSWCNQIFHTRSRIK